MTTTDTTLPYLVKKYSHALPHYTGYPAMQHWNGNLTADKWKVVFSHRFHGQNAANGISLSIHLPFCESLCLNCGCGKKAASHQAMETDYLKLIRKEWHLYRSLMKETPVIRELHLSGGVASFYAPEQLEQLLTVIISDCLLQPQHSFSIEGHPNNTSTPYLEMFYNTGFRHISFRVQDTDPTVERLISRLQPVEKVVEVTGRARAIGFTHISLDLVYGLPAQTPQTMKSAIDQCVALQPDRIALYNYEHTPWAGKVQRVFDNYRMPDAEESRALYFAGKRAVLQQGYHDLGMDRFCLPTDPLYKAKQAVRLHRNYGGYTTLATPLLLGLGVSSVSDAGAGLAQNEKSISHYAAAINSGELAIARGHCLSEEDQRFGRYITELICRSRTVFNPVHLPLLEETVFPQLEKLSEDGLVEWSYEEVRITEKGRYFIGAVCRAFDLYHTAIVATIG